MNRGITISCLLLCIPAIAWAQAAPTPAAPTAPAPARASVSSAAPAHASPAMDSTSESFLVGVLLHTTLDVSFDETPVREALETIRSALGIPLIARYRSTSQPVGIDGDAPVFLNARAQRALDVLETVLAQCSTDEACTWQIRPGFVEVGPKSRLNESQITRVYPIQDLTLEPPYFGDAHHLGLPSMATQAPWDPATELIEFNGRRIPLSRYVPPTQPIQRGSGMILRKVPEELAKELVEIITSTIEPKAWDVKGGDVAVIRYYTQGGLVIYAPNYIHRQIGGTARPLGPAEIARVREEHARGTSDVQASPTPAAPSPRGGDPSRVTPSAPRPASAPSPGG